MTRLARAFTGSQEAAEDIVAEAFVGVHRAWATIQNPVGYLKTSVINGCRTWLRRELVANSKLAIIASSDTTVDSDYHDLLPQLRRLDERSQTVLCLRYYLDLADSEIAEIMGIRRSSVRSIAHRALHKLRQEMDS